MADLTELKNTVRIGTVHSVDEEKMTARVKFADKGGMISGELHVIKRKVLISPSKERAGETGKTEETEIEFDYSNELKKDSHFHKAYIKDWMPDVGEMVLCIMIADGEGDGFVIGGI